MPVRCYGETNLETYIRVTIFSLKLSYFFKKSRSSLLPHLTNMNFHYKGGRIIHGETPTVCRFERLLISTVVIFPL